MLIAVVPEVVVGLGEESVVRAVVVGERKS